LQPDKFGPPRIMSRPTRKDKAPMANVKEILRDLRAERDKLDAAIQALQGIDHSGRAPNGRRHRSIKATTRRARRRMSAAGRARIAAAQRARWAKIRGKKT